MIRALILAGIAFIATVIISCGGVDDDFLVVTSTSGLVLRAKPDSNSSRIVAMPWNSHVDFLDEGPQATYYGITDHWLKVRYNGQEGWAFGGLLSNPTICDCKISDSLQSSTMSGECMLDGYKFENGGMVGDKSGFSVLSNGQNRMVLVEYEIGRTGPEGKSACWNVIANIPLNRHQNADIMCKYRNSDRLLDGFCILNSDTNGEVQVDSAYEIHPPQIKNIDPSKIEYFPPCEGEECI